MTTKDQNSSVVQFAQNPPVPSTGGGGGGRDDLSERIARLETRIEYLATKEDIQSMANTQLKWVIGVFVTVIVGVLAVLFRALE